MPSSPGWVVRIRNRYTSDVVGAGALIPEGRVLTCAHVVRDALRAPGGRRELLTVPSQTEPVVVDSPSHDPEWSSLAHVLPGAWPRCADDPDATVLALDRDLPAALRAADLARCVEVMAEYGEQSCTVAAYGYPVTVPTGLWAEARLVAPGGRPGGQPGHVQLVASDTTGARVMRGFSGAGVRDYRTGAVIGIVTSEYTDSQARVGWMLSLDTIAESWDWFAPLLDAARPPTAGDGAPAGDGPGAVLRVCAALAEITSLGRPAVRGQVVRAINRELPRPLATPAFPDEDPGARLHLEAVVDECWWTPGGRPALRTVIRYMFPGSAAAALLDRVSIPPIAAFVDAATEHQLRDLLSDLDFPGVRRAFAIAAEKQPDEIRAADFADAWEALSLLTDAMPDHGLPPYLAFVELLITELERTQEREHAGAVAYHDLVGPLREWSTGTAQTLAGEGVSGVWARLAELRAKAGLAREKHRGYLIFAVELLDPPRGPGTDGRCVLSHWRQTGTDRGRPQRLGSEEVALSRLPERVVEVLAAVESRWSALEDVVLSLEFLLDDELLKLDLPVDHWGREIAEGVESIPIGLQYEVVVRSLRRHRAMPSEEWTRRWHALWTPDGDVRMLWITPEEIPGQRDLIARLLSDRAVTAVMLSAPPTDPRGYWELRIALHLGIPVVVWNRLADSRQQSETRHALGRVIGVPEREGVRKLRESVRELRIAAFSAARPDSGDEPPPGWDLTLLWDDPQRRVDGVRLTRPL